MLIATSPRYDEAEVTERPVECQQLKESGTMNQMIRSSGWSTDMESSHTRECLRKRSYSTARSVDGKAKERAADSATKRR